MTKVADLSIFLTLVNSVQSEFCKYQILLALPNPKGELGLCSFLRMILLATTQGAKAPLLKLANYSICFSKGLQLLATSH
jgi:hypothetical protein